MKYQSSLTLLLTSMRKADKESIIIMDGISCCKQIEQLAGREGLHIAQVLQIA
ncbi:MAG: hypothetical protein ABI237_07185 [Ginsengibacter sp.]